MQTTSHGTAGNRRPARGRRGAPDRSDVVARTAVPDVPSGVRVR